MLKLFWLKLSCFEICKPKHPQQIMRNIILSIPVIFYILAYGICQGVVDDSYVQHVRLDAQVG